MQDVERDNVHWKVYSRASSVPEAHLMEQVLHNLSTNYLYGRIIHPDGNTN